MLTGGVDGVFIDHAEHEYGLLRPSFIPDAQVAALRQRTRYRKKLIEQRSSEGQRLAKVLEDAGFSELKMIKVFPGQAVFEGHRPGG
jgi:hypothetical protein